MMSLTQIRDRLAHAHSSEKMSSAEQKLFAKHFPEQRLFMGTRTWCNLESDEAMDMVRSLNVFIAAAAADKEAGE